MPSGETGPPPGAGGGCLSCGSGPCAWRVPAIRNATRANAKMRVTIATIRLFFMSGLLDRKHAAPAPGTCFARRLAQSGAKVSDTKCHQIVTKPALTHLDEPGGKRCY